MGVDAVESNFCGTSVFSLVQRLSMRRCSEKKLPTIMKSLMSILLALGFGVSGFAADEKKEESKPAATEPAKEKRKAVDPEEAFKKMDANSDGKVSLEEFKSGKKDAAAAEERFKKLDKNGDGSLTKDEAFPVGKKKDK